MCSAFRGIAGAGRIVDAGRIVRTGKMAGASGMASVSVSGMAGAKRATSAGEGKAPLKRKLRKNNGQATIEAAFALPILMLLVLLLLQPGIVLYDRIVMHGAAAEGCRLITTSADAGSSVNEDFIRRRLSAVPQIDQFHVHSGGCTWQIEFTGNEASSEVGIKISTEVKPLPLLDFGMALAGLVNARGNLVIEVEASAPTQPDWIAGASEGRDPGAWPGI